MNILTHHGLIIVLT